MLDQGRIKSFTDIFLYLPKSVLAADLGKNLKRFNELLLHVEGFTIKDLVIICNLCGLTRMEMFRLIDEEFVTRERTTKDKRKSSF
jgi:hypothetical protein